MSEHSWGEIFNLNEELKKIEEEVDRRLEETLGEDPHVIEQETVHYGSPDNYRMQQSMPTYEEPTPIEETPTEEIPTPTEEEPAAEEPEAEPEAEAEEPAKVIEFPTPVDESVDEEPKSVEETEPAEETAPVEEESVAPEESEEEATPTASEELTPEPEPEPIAEEPTPAPEPIVEEPAPKPEPVVEKAPEQKPAEAQPDNRRKILVILIAAIVVLAAVFGILYANSQRAPREQYENATALLEAGDYDGAIEAYTASHGYKDAAERIMEAQYAKASALVSAGSFGEAVDYIDSLSSPSDAMLNLRASAIYQTAVQDYADGNLDLAVSELTQIEDYETDGISAKGLLNQIYYQQASDALAIYDFDAAEPILEALGDYEDAPILLEQVQDAVDIVYTDVARDDDGVEIAGKSEYLWVHSVITPGQIPAGSSDEEVIAALREIAGATDEIDDAAVRVLMMHQATTDAEMLYIDADPIKTDKADVITMDISQYAGIDETFGTDQMIYSPQTLQRSNTDFALAFEGSEAYAGKTTKKDSKKDKADDAAKEVRMECKMADDGYWVKTRRVYAEMEDGKLVGVPQHQLRTWTKVTTESVADEVRQAFLTNQE